MSEIDPTHNRNPPNPHRPPGALGDGNPTHRYHPDLGKDGGWGAFKDWLGEKDFIKFQKGLCDTITRQIKKDQETAKKASEKLKKSLEGKDDD